MKKGLLPLLILTVLTLNSFSQVFDPQQENFQYHVTKSKNQMLTNLLEEHIVPPFRTCGTMDYYNMEVAADPNRAIKLNRINAEIEDWIKNNQEYLSNGKVLITIPVVVHVVYNTTAQNISDAQVLSQIAVLNNDYRNTNSDGSSVPSTFQSLRADCEIEFCLATIDPQGNPTTGITRTQTSTSSFSMSNNAVKYTAQGGKDIWDRNQYLNIWVCNLGGGLLGYAQFPGGTAATDGVVINYTAFGNMGTAQAPYNKGRSATHEIGHWLHLYHVWGDDNGACTGSDQCNDTPNSADAYYGCPNHPQTSCSSTDMFMNYMDYVDDACMMMFSLDQKARMVAALNGARSSILTSSVCQSTGTPPDADFTANVTTIPLGGSVNFTDLSTNTPTSWSWSFTGGTPATSTLQNPTGITYNTAGLFPVSLTATNAHGSNTETKTDYIEVIDGPVAPIADFVANVTTIPEGGSVNFTDLSANLPTSWDWTFTGGTPATSNLQNPTNIVYSTAGTYEVILTVTNAAGNDTHTKIDYINVVVPGVPVADFTANQTTINVGGSVNFTDLSTNFPSSWNWTFTGGSPASSTDQNPTGISYAAAGTYTVSLTVSNNFGTDTHTKTDYINVTTGTIGTCDTLNLPMNGTPALYLSPAGHYATGTNEYRDKAKAQYFDSFSPYYRIMGGVYWFGAATGTSTNVTFSVWDNTGSNGKPGSTPLVSKSMPISTIVGNVTNQQMTYVMFDNPIIVIDPFYMGVDIPQTPGDTLALKSNSSGQGGNPCKAWEQWANDQWYDFTTAWSGNLDVKLGIFPIICFTADIEEADAHKISIYPNPANSFLTLDFIDNAPQSLEIEIYNSTGSLVKSFKNMSSQVLRFDLDIINLNSGLYHLSVKTEKGVFNHKFTVIK
ncbi:MAG: PKD domain-containing protein [Bacteroidales bacterium]|nr:PKD domain-containing protein [Bacteroidales bacterium]